MSDDLLELQRLDTQADQLRHRRSRLPEREAADAAAVALARVSQRTDELRRRDEDLAAAIASLEHDSEQLTAHRERLEAQLKTVIAPREAEALMHEIDGLTQRRDELDERELEHMEEQGANAEELAALAASTPDLQSSADAAASVAAAAEGVVDGDLATGETARAEIVGRVDADVLADYERRRQHFGGIGLARLDGRRCTGCNLDLSPAELDQVRATPSGQWTDCPECGRMLVP
ncbi:MAG: zinc ribbon domain-containing protein [Desertimonas sp.]